MGLEISLERCDSYGSFGYLFLKKSNIFILGEFCKITHCPYIETLALLFFISVAKDDLLLIPLERNNNRQNIVKSKIAAAAASIKKAYAYEKL